MSLKGHAVDLEMCGEAAQQNSSTDTDGSYDTNSVMLTQGKHD